MLGLLIVYAKEMTYRGVGHAETSHVIRGLGFEPGDTCLTFTESVPLDTEFSHTANDSSNHTHTVKSQ